jgi:A/G-specific adenine glycosylase
MIEQESSAWLLEPVLLSSYPSSLQKEILSQFSAHILSFHQHNGRPFPWRQTNDPYKILLSELMLQQTQTERVLPKYQEFISVWPDFSSMASSSLLEVLSRWKGLGYNRRALALRNIASMTEQYGWTLPNDYGELLKFPMIGPSTAAAILAFSYATPAIYLETNIRRVLIHQFYPEQEKVLDKDLRVILSELMPLQKDPKTWYYALMDYGVFLKKLLVNPNRRSAHYNKQGKFEDSNRQIRGMLLLYFTEKGAMRKEQLYASLPFEHDRIDECLQALCKEGFIQNLTQKQASLGLQIVSEQEHWYGIS